MHPDIKQEQHGKCPKCGMELIPKDEIKNQAMTHKGQDAGHAKSVWKDYAPLIVIIKLILLTALTISLRDLQTGSFEVTKSLSYFMIGFFLVFSGFKLMDLKGFSQGYSTYDLLAKRWFAYGYIYPFIELFFGLGMILSSDARWLLITELIVMAFSGLGVALKLMKKEKFKCACLGTFLKVPLTKVTLIEDFGMSILAGIMLLFS